MTHSPQVYPGEGRKKIVIFGAGGFGRLAYVYFSLDSPYEVAAFTVHQKYLKENSLLGLDVVAFEEVEEMYPPEHFAMFVAIGYERVNRARADVYYACKQKGYELVSYISSKTVYWGEREIGDNCFIFENNSIHPFVTIGNDVVIGSGNHIGHDSSIEDHCFISGHVMIPGYVTVGQYSFLGANVTLKDGITIAPECIIGAGCLILKDTRPQEVYITEGTRPAKVTSPILGGLMHSPFFRNDRQEK